MANGIDGINRSNLFVKSSTDDFQDPVFLTFTIDFFPPSEQYPKFDGLTNSALLREPESADFLTKNNLIGQNSVVEYSAETWLKEYYPNKVDSMDSPVVSVRQFKNKLKEIQDSPWYIQSIQGIGDLWKAAHRVKEGTMKSTLTFNCIDSIKQPLTEMAENYRHAAYDQQRLAYRLPENLRWFDMVITLVEIRDIADRSGQFYQVGQSGALESGLRVVQFKCKMCEFDFSNFMGGSQSDHKVYTEEKPFSPSFDVNVNWVIQEKVALEEANDYRKMGIFAGALDTLNNRLSRLIQNLTRLPAGIVGSVLNEIQTFVEVNVMGNVYEGANSFLNDLNNISGDITGRTPPVGPPLISNVGDDVYPGSEDNEEVGLIGESYPRQTKPLEVEDLGDLYPDIPTQEINDMDDIYEDVEPVEVSEMEDIYEDVPGVEVPVMDDIYEDVEPVEVNDIGDIYEDVPGTEITDIGDIYEDIPNTPASDMGDLYEDEATPSVSDIGDIYPNEPPAPDISDMGDLYPNLTSEDVSDMGDLYVNEANPDDVKEIGDLYPDESPAAVAELGEIYSKESTESIASMDDIYVDERKSDSIDDIGDIYPDEPKPEAIDDMGDTYPDEKKSDDVKDMGDSYQ